MMAGVGGGSSMSGEGSCQCKSCRQVSFRAGEENGRSYKVEGIRKGVCCSGNSLGNRYKGEPGGVCKVAWEVFG